MPSTSYTDVYRSTGDVSMRHSGTYVAVFDPETAVYVPYHCIDSGGNTRDPEFHLREVTPSSRRDRRNTLTLNLSDSNLFINRPELGMVNLIEEQGKGVACWASGSAIRQYKRSLSTQMYQLSLCLDTSSVYCDWGHRDNIYNTLYTFWNKEYPLFSQVLNDIQEGIIYSGAFSSKFALAATSSKGIVLYYKNKIVGYVDDNNQPVLLSTYDHLNEQLEETFYAYEKSA